MSCQSRRCFVSLWRFMLVSPIRIISYCFCCRWVIVVCKSCKYCVWGLVQGDFSFNMACRWRCHIVFGPEVADPTGPYVASTICFLQLTSSIAVHRPHPLGSWPMLGIRAYRASAGWTAIVMPPIWPLEKAWENAGLIRDERPHHSLVSSHSRFCLCDIVRRWSMRLIIRVWDQDS